MGLNHRESMILANSAHYKTICRMLNYENTIQKHIISGIFGKIQPYAFTEYTENY